MNVSANPNIHTHLPISVLKFRNKERDQMAKVSLDELCDLDLFILYTLNKSESGIPSETHYQKIMFQAMKILGKNPEEVGYVPHYYGPNSHLMDEKKDSLLMLGYLDSKGNGVDIDPSEKKTISRINPPTPDLSFKLELMVEKLCSFKNDELLLVIYYDDLKTTNGKFIENSYVKDDIFRNRIPIAVKMYKTKKVTLCRAAELADLSVREFENEVIRRLGGLNVN